MMNLSNNRREFLKTAALAGVGVGISGSAFGEIFNDHATIPTSYPYPFLPTARVGMIGLDTSHCEAFAKVLNDPDVEPDLAGFRIVAAYPQGSKDIESSVSRIPKITEEMKKYGVQIVGSIDNLLKQVDVVLLETNDGRLHYEQALPVLKAGKRLFIDKPIASTLADTVAIFKAAKKYNVPVFSSSSLRFIPAVQDIAKGKTVGKVTGLDVHTPCIIEKTHPDLFWYGIHGIETIYTIMGRGCKQVVRVHQEDTDLVVGTWQDGRIATFRGTRNRKHDYGGTAFGKTEIGAFSADGDYEPLLKEIVQFFKTGNPPVSAEETIEICTFMEAADESKRLGGVPVELENILKKVK
ncbi:Gfo/Idh/MocA family oxidoreductase [soil metagenome]